MPETFYTSSQYYNLPTPVHLYVRLSFPLKDSLSSTFYFHTDESGADTGFTEGGGGVGGGWRHSQALPLDIARVTSSAPQEIDKHPLGHSQTAPPLDIARVTSSAAPPKINIKLTKLSSTLPWTSSIPPWDVQGEGVTGPVTYALHRFRTSWGGGDHPCHTPPGSATAS